MMESLTFTVPQCATNPLCCQRYCTRPQMGHSAHTGAALPLLELDTRRRTRYGRSRQEYPERRRKPGGHAEVRPLPAWGGKAVLVKQSPELPLMPGVEHTNEEESGEAGNLYTHRADADWPGGRGRDCRSGGCRAWSPTGDVRLPARWPAGPRRCAECPGEPLRPAAAERCLARGAGAAAGQAHHHWHQLQRARRRGREGDAATPAAEF